MATPTSTEGRELALVEKVEMKIALAKDEKLESLLKVYLAPLLLKLGSDHQSVRNKVSIRTCLNRNASRDIPLLSITNYFRLFQHANI